MKALADYLKKDQFIQHCEIELLEVAAGHARAKMTLHPYHYNALGTVQGGAIFTLADYTLRRCRTLTPASRSGSREYHLHEGSHDRHALGRGQGNQQEFQ